MDRFELARGLYENSQQLTEGLNLDLRKKPDRKLLRNIVVFTATKVPYDTDFLYGIGKSGSTICKVMSSYNRIPMVGRNVQVAGRNICLIDFSFEDTTNVLRVATGLRRQRGKVDIALAVIGMGDNWEAELKEARIDGLIIFDADEIRRLTVNK